MKRHAPAAGRNSAPIADVLGRELPERGRVLEIASGTGEHAVCFAQRFPHLTWQPSDADPDALPSISAWAAEAGLGNLREPVTINAAETPWPVDHADAILCINMVHISPWSATEGLVREAGRLLSRGAPLILYGPYRETDVDLAPSNHAFDAWLKEQDAEYGLRSLQDLDRLAARSDLRRTGRYEMPANNLTLVYRRQ